MQKWLKSVSCKEGDWSMGGRAVSNRITWAAFTFLDDIQILAKGKQLGYEWWFVKNAHVICEPLERKSDRWIVVVILITLTIAPLSSVVTWNVKLGFFKSFIHLFGCNGSQLQHTGSLIFMWDLVPWPGIEPGLPA